MADPTEDPDFELRLNTLSAEQTVFGITLQVMLMHMGQTRRQLFDAIRAEVLASIDNTEPSPDDPQAAERHKQATKMHAERFFQVIEATLGKKPTRSGPSASN